MSKQIKNMTDLTNNLVEKYQALESGSLDIKKAREHTNIAGKIISTVKTQLTYNIHTKSKRKIAFLEG